MSINLLPIDLSPSRGSVKTAATLKKIIVLLSGIFLCIVIFGIVLILFMNTQINASMNRQDNLKKNIQALNVTEQKLFLTKDRLDKIKTVSQTLGGEGYFESLNQILTSLPQNVSVISINIDVSETKFSVLSKDSLGMASFLNSLVASGVYKNITLTDFTFTPDIGYTISLKGA